MYAGDYHRPLRIPDLPTFRLPLDLGTQGRADPEFAPFYLPETYPTATMDEMVAEAYFNSPSLYQHHGEWINPFRIQRQEVEHLREDSQYRTRRLAQAVALAYLFREDDLQPEAIVEALLSRPLYVNHELVAQVVIPRLEKMLPWQITQVEGSPGLVATDLSVHTATSYDCVAPLEPLLLRAAKRGLQAIVIADRGRIDGAQRAQQVAERLKREGRLPPDFTVIIGESVYTTAGEVLAVFVEERIPERMTLGATVKLIHDQGGLVYLAHPGMAGGPRMLRDLPFDGYLIRSGFFQMFRTLEILYDPRLQDKTALYASGSLYAAGPGLPYSLIEAESTDPAVLREALAQHRAYAASGLYLPYMGAITVKPIGLLLRTMNYFFVFHDNAEVALTRMLHADNAQIFTSWDKEMAGWMGLWDLPSGAKRFLQGRSPLTSVPEVLYISAEYGPVRVQYELKTKRVTLESVLAW